MSDSNFIRGSLKELSCVAVEDQGLFLEMLESMLHMRTRCRVVGNARNVKQGKQICSRHRPDILILDLDLPDGSGLEVAKHLLNYQPSARIIIISGHASGFICPGWLNKNLHAVISKQDTFATIWEELDEIQALRKPADGGKNNGPLADKPLTARETEIFALIGRGMQTKEIGATLNISTHTVQTHRKRIAVKLGTTGAELVQRAIIQQQALLSKPSVPSS